MAREASNDGGGPPDLPDDLRELVGLARASAANLAMAEAEHAYQVALLAQAALGRSVAEDSAMAICAKALGVAGPTLRAFAVLATRWARHEFTALFARRDPRGRT